jgi:hypothetical protein
VIKPTVTHKPDNTTPNTAQFHPKIQKLRPTKNKHIQKLSQPKPQKPNLTSKNETKFKKHTTNPNHPHKNAKKLQNPPLVTQHALHY